MLANNYFIKSWPNVDLVGFEYVLLGRVEDFATNLLEAQRLHHRVEEDLEEVEVVSVSRLHDLDPFKVDSVLSAFDCGLHFWYVTALYITVDAAAPRDVELDLLSDLVSEVQILEMI